MRHKENDTTFVIDSLWRFKLSSIYTYNLRCKLIRRPYCYRWIVQCHNIGPVTIFKLRQYLNEHYRFSTSSKWCAGNLFKTQINQIEHYHYLQSKCCGLDWSGLHIKPQIEQREYADLRWMSVCVCAEGTMSPHLLYDYIVMVCTWGCLSQNTHMICRYLVESWRCRANIFELVSRYRQQMLRHTHPSGVLNMWIWWKFFEEHYIHAITSMWV